jgi:hypothetical protein
VGFAAGGNTAAFGLACGAAFGAASDLRAAGFEATRTLTGAALGMAFLTDARESFFDGALPGFLARLLDFRAWCEERFFFFSARWSRAGMGWINSFLAMARKDS